MATLKLQLCHPFRISIRHIKRGESCRDHGDCSLLGKLIFNLGSIPELIHAVISWVALPAQQRELQSGGVGRRKGEMELLALILEWSEASLESGSLVQQESGAAVLC